jgi:aspartyl-tRNA(Asn)/glutamyl-tRNA(Gln) amidotransferase subunit A
MDLIQSTMIELRDAIAAKKVTATRVTEAYLQRIAALNDELGAYTQVFAERALQRAAEVDAGRATGSLAGVPIAIKDNLCTTFGRTTCSSKMLENFESPYDATVVRRLEAAGAVILGKTNLDEFAMGSSTENSAFAPTRNPWDTTRVPGGSSGGSAAAVAAGLCAAALGSDTGGSIRQPAALCGIVGLKPTYGLVSRYGLVAYASSLDQIGPMTRSVGDAALLLNVIAGHDPLDSTSADDEARGSTSGDEIDYLAALGQPVDKLRIGLARQYLSDANDPQVNAAIDAAVAQLREFGAEIVEVDLPHTEYGIATYYIVATAEASSNLARYDGVHYGHRTPKPDDLIDLYAASRAEGFGDEVKRRIMLGTYTLSSGYYDAYYLRALKVRRLIKQDFDQAFAQCDAILCPTTTHPAFAFGDKTDDPLAMYLNDVYTVNCNLAGIPGLALPAGFAEADERRLPIGLQLLGPTFSESRLFQIAAALIGNQPAPLAGSGFPE